MSMVMDGDVESVVNDMYKLEYENPDNQMVKNTLGWVLLHAQKPEQALAVYGKLVEANAVTGDFSMLMNAFYAFLVNGKARKGVEMLNVYCMSLDGEQQQHFPDMVADAMRDDAGLLAKYSIGKAEKAIILSQFAFLTL
jgi:predicted Zn-dependent protease